MSTPQIQNPRSAFGGQSTASTGSPPAGAYALTGPTPTIEEFRNASTTNPIRVGNAVCYALAVGGSSANTTLGVFVEVSTVIGNPRFCGVAITSAAVRDTTLGQSAEFCKVVTKGVVYGAHLNASSLGDLIWVSNTTAAGFTSNGGELTVVAATAAGNYAVAGWALSSGTTGTTGFLSTAGPRGVVMIDKSIVAAISTA